MHYDEPKAMATLSPSSELHEDLAKRAELARERATTLEHEAREHRAVEQACHAALESLTRGEPDGQSERDHG
jgi:hypothetical protein